MAVQLEKAVACQMCGTSPHDWEDDPLAFVPVQAQCLGCAAKERLRGSDDVKTLPGSSVRLVPRDIAEKMAAQQAEMPNRRPKSARERAQERDHT